MKFSFSTPTSRQNALTAAAGGPATADGDGRHPRVVPAAHLARVDEFREFFERTTCETFNRDISKTFGRYRSSV